MIRKIIKIDEEKCNGCGLCASACHEGAIDIIDGKAKLVRENFCDGFGDCLPNCPTGAISFEEREAPAYDEAAVLASKQAKAAPLPCSCPGSACQSIQPNEADTAVRVPSCLSNFPV
ncbi:MAG: 4Fe-4S binding protein, partial [Firmicutes bacterium]|nr:4Fe-4S binding protein [Bacillota bacterium]